MYVLHTFLLTICFEATRVCAGYEVINSEIIERIDLDNSHDLQRLAGAGKASPSPKISHHVEEKPRHGEEYNGVQGVLETSSVSSHQPSIIYAAIQAMPHIIASQNGQEESASNDQSTMKSVTVLPDNKKPHSKLEDPSEDKTKNVKAKLYSHLKQSLPKLYNILNVELQNTHDTEDKARNEPMQEATLKHANVQPYATIIDDEKDLKAEQTEDVYPYVVYDKQDYLKPKTVRKTVKTHKIGDEKKNVYPKEEVKSSVPEYKGKDDMETDNTIWIGYGLGVPAYKYPYTYPSPLYSNYNTYGRPYSGWGYNRGYTGGQYYGGYVDRTGLGSSYAGGVYNNYGTGYGPYGGY